MQEDRNSIFQMRFPQKLWYLLNLRTDAILWGGTGRTLLLNYRVLHSYLQCDHSIFKTTNISSFVRQLNLYGFRKVTSHLQDPLCNSSNPYMHEYVHDYFQFGRPELLNQITRKALTIKRTFKSKTNSFNTIEQTHCLSPLQKARHALRVALKKAAQEMFMQNSPKNMGGMRFEYEDSQDEEDDNNDFDWQSLNDPPSTQPTPVTNTDSITFPLEDISAIKQETDHSETSEVKVENSKEQELECDKKMSQDSLMNFTDNSQQNSDSFPNQFLSMPDLESEPADSKCVELLAEFNIDMEQGLTRKMSEDNGHGSLNCVLPSISQDHNDIMSMAENHDGITDHYTGDWDQMINEIMTNKGHIQESSDLKELYSQISKTIDLLNS